MKVAAGRALDYLQRHWWMLALIVALAFAGALFSFRQGEDRGPAQAEIVERNGRQIIEEHPGGRGIPAWAVGTGLLSAFLGVLAIAVFINGSTRRQVGDSETRRRMINDLSKSLNSAFSTIDAVKKEIQEGQDLLTRLEEETASKSQLAQLTTEEAKAVVAQMEDVARNETSRSTLYQLLMGLGFFIAGIVSTLLLTD